jgi:hypothetical protein
MHLPSRVPDVSMLRTVWIGPTLREGPEKAPGFNSAPPHHPKNKGSNPGARPIPEKKSEVSAPHRFCIRARLQSCQRRVPPKALPCCRRLMWSPKERGRNLVAAFA